MSNVTRRTFNKFLGAGAGVMAMPGILRAQGRKNVVIVGGGAGGATVARHLAEKAGGAINITLIEDSEKYTTCFFSNLYLGGYRDFASITHGYDRLVNDYGIRKVTARAEEIDRTAQQVRTSTGETIPYDRLVLSPGIDLIFDSVPGYSAELAEIAPHAWQAGPQTQLLKSKIDGLKNGDQVVMVAPPNPYRCPPGPYERVSMIAHTIKARGLTDCTIVVLDPKEKFSKQGLFAEGWEKYYPGMVEWYGPNIHGGIKGVDVEAGSVETDFDTFSGALLNIIPAQQAGSIAISTGLSDDSGFCPVDAESMRSKRDQNIFVIGDASIAGAMPKSGSAANSQAKVVVMHLMADLMDARVFPARYLNTCWSLVETNDGIKVGAQYGNVDGAIASTSSFISQPDESADVRRHTFEESVAWYDGITKDMFG
ncbi:NAD(P)/FAD-dependent oxidoreductase [Thalassospira profundimaris]|uniref:NAD(P)/FAD-dependent oxidoreductase n=1 Tax=Thalassospira profundimaris TaxID=502049 RepID=UPI0002873EEB|nr:NAD(P)/FAD-dependent oxidoreductase [Thalassospira profundimaris]EKF07486.1 flavocytochrome c sulfide dehydrogenase flavin-binding family protein [Thalassospira profundimaris WP0211]